MNIESLSKGYKVRRLNNENIEEIYELCKSNPLYYDYCPPMVTKEIILKEFSALPQNTTIEDKYYIGFYDSDNLIAVMDLIDGYPNKDVCFIGFFMTSKNIHNKGIGSEIISDVVDYLKNENYSSIRLAWVKGNPQAEHFWLKNEFKAIKETSSTAGDCVILSERKL